MSTSLSPEQQSAYRAKMGMTDDAIVKAITDYAKQPKQYENGWSFVVEAWDRTQILSAIGCAYSLRGAVKALAPIASAFHEQMLSQTHPDGVPETAPTEQDQPGDREIDGLPLDHFDTEQPKPKPARRSRTRKAS